MNEHNEKGIEENITEIQSLCPSCEKQGTSKLLPTNIPFYKDIVIASFECPHCHLRNNEVMLTEDIKPYGIRYKLEITQTEDYDRMVVKTDYATIYIPQLELEIPPTKKSDVNTIEGIIQKVYDDLMQDYGETFKQIAPEKPEVDEQSKQIISLKNFTDTLCKLLTEKPTSNITLLLDDPSGNSFVENPNAPNSDANLSIIHYDRTNEQNIALGFSNIVDQTSADANKPITTKVPDFQSEQEFNATSEVLQFPGHCSACQFPCVTNMKIVDIPHFHELIIMSSLCDKCGNRSTEIKPGGGINDMGCRIELKLRNSQDLKRELIKSDYCEICIPEFDIHLSPTTLGAKYTTVEGFLRDMIEQLKEANPFVQGDSSLSPQSAKFTHLIDTLQQSIDLLDTKNDNLSQDKSPTNSCTFTLVLDDPTGNSFITHTTHTKTNDPHLIGQYLDTKSNTQQTSEQSQSAEKLISDCSDENIKITFYQRTWQQNEDLGINDMKTD